MPLYSHLKKFLFATILSVIISCNPWSSETDEALEMSGSNRAELEAVLRYYYDLYPDTLKFKAAEYIISNMVYQYSRYGPGVDSLNEIYKDVYGIYRRDRNAVIMSDSVIKRREYKIDAQYDLLRLTAGHLIRQIESAFDTYNRFEWCKKYPFETFCEYILPFNIRNADSTEWRSKAYEKYAEFLEYVAFKTPDIRHEAELLTRTPLLKVKVEGASQQFTYNLQKNNAEIFELTFDTKRSGFQLFNIHYLNGHKTAAKVRVVIDSITIRDVVFPSTGDWRIIDQEVPPVDFTVMLDSGRHTLTLMALDKNILIDFVEVPDYIYMRFSDSLVEEGQYYLSNRLGRLTVQRDTLINVSPIKIHPSTGRPVKVLPKGNLYQLLLPQVSGPIKAIDAFPSNNSDWVQVYDDHGFDNQLWAFIPLNNGGYQIRNKATGRILAFRGSDSTLVQLSPELMQDDYIWHLEKINLDSGKDSPNQLDIAVRTAQKISEITNRFHWSGSYAELGPINPNIILDYTYGSCVEETDFQTMVLRSMGIACSVDFVFNYPERNAGHTWSVIFDLNGNTVQNNCHNPVGAGTWVDIFAKGKVYRKTNTINKNSLMVINNNGEPIPMQFQNPYFIDVTKEYCRVRDIEINISLEAKATNRFGYLMVFNNDGWVPIGWGEKENNAITFKDVEPGPMYMPAFYVDGYFEAFNAPFWFDSLGNIHYTKNSNEKMDLSIARKSPNRLVNETHHKLILGGKFQGANKSDFSDAITIGTITDQMLDPVFHLINTESKKSFKYLRYIGPDNGRCNINEIIFIDTNGHKIEGKIIGTEGSCEHNGKTREMAFDGDVLTYFDAPEPSGNWVGLHLSTPTAVDKIRFATRNDGNMVEIGDEYELVYWDYKQWKSLGRKVAVTDSVTYHKVPKGVLYWLKNHTKGWEERIFTLDENEKQVWW